MIVTTSKQLIVPPYRVFRSLDEAMRKADDGHNIDLWAMAEVKDPGGFSQGRTSFRCHSFLKAFIDYLCSKGREGIVPSTDWAGCNRNMNNSNDDSACTSSLDMVSNSLWLGPIVGTGTTPATINDYKMEKPCWHGTLAANLNVHSNTATSTSWVDPIFQLVKSAAGWATNAYQNMMLAITNGAANGWEGRIDSNTATVLYTTHTSSTFSGTRQNCFPPINPGATPTFTVKNYGQLTWSSAAITAPTDDGALQSKFSISRDFTNNQGGAFTINEAGILASMSIGRLGTYPYAVPHLIVRDVLGAPVTLQNGQIMTLTYNIIVNA